MVRDDEVRVVTLRVFDRDHAQRSGVRHGRSKMTPRVVTIGDDDDGRTDGHRAKETI